MNEYDISCESIVDQMSLFKNVPCLYNLIKRIFDILAALSGLILLAPVLILVAAAIKIDSKGPVFFCQKRMGFKGRPFNMYKFRSMEVEAENKLIELIDKNEVGGYVFKIRNDPRVTRVGRYIRKTSIDEFPQLINIIAGDMSFVGPRPPIVYEVKKYDHWHKLRLSVKPGLTGLWQISGRNNIGFEDMCRLDLKYIRERRLIYDLKIIFKTIPVLFGDSKAF